MLDPIYSNPRLAAIYDAFDGPRDDLAFYEQIISTLGVRTVLDIGCGTGTLAATLAGKQHNVIGLDPAAALLTIARRKPNASKVHWICGEVSTLQSNIADVAVMTGNAAQVFTTDAAWEDFLAAAHNALHKDGYFIFEVRNPAQKTWLGWRRESTYQRLHIDGIGYVEGWCDLVEVADQLVSFEWTYHFEADGAHLTSRSTIRFRAPAQIETDLHKAGFTVDIILDAPDRPGLEFVFVVRKL